MVIGVVTPAQVRAGRAFLGWSQEQLAQEAEVGLSTVRDIESERRAPETGAVTSIRRALWNGGVVFLTGRHGEGPGVRLVANRPNIIRRPTAMLHWEGMPFTAEWHGKAVTVLVSFELIEDLGLHRGNTTDEAYLKTFEKHRGEILDAVSVAIASPENFDQLGRLCISQEHIDGIRNGQWYRVTLDKAEDVRDMEARSLMNKFAAKFIESGIPPNVEVFHMQGADGRHIYYFSPAASQLADELLSTFNAVACAVKPDLSSARKIKL